MQARIFSSAGGLMNTKAAADLIAAHAGSPRAPKLIAGSLDAEHPVCSYVIAVEGDAPLRATLCWTDPPGEALTWVDETVPALVNDLDLRILGPDGTTLWNPYLPKKDSPAARGDNTRDNVEQVYVAAPPTPGLYTLKVSHKGVLEEGVQPFSLVVSGTASEFLAVEPVARFLISGEVGGPFSPTEKEYTLTNMGASSLTWTAARTNRACLTGTLRDALPGADVFIGVSAPNIRPPTHHTESGAADHGTLSVRHLTVGMTAPLLLVGAAAFVPRPPEGILSIFTAVPIQIYAWVSENDIEFTHVASAAIVVLLVILFVLYAFAFWLRRRFRSAT